MAATSSSRGTTQPPPTTATVPVDDRDYVNPGVFVMPWRPVYIVEDASLLRRLAKGVPVVDIPWDALATLKIHAPEIAQDIIIAGWEGVGDLVRQLEATVLRGMQYK